MKQPTKYEILVELTKYFGKIHQDRFLTWNKEYLVKLLNIIKANNSATWKQKK